MNDFVKDNWFKLIVVIVLLAVGSSVIYYYLVSKPAQDEAASQQSTSAQDQAATQTTSQAQQLQDCVSKAEQDFENSYASLCKYYQTNQNQLSNPNWVCPLASTASYPGSPYPGMVSKEQSDEALCATLYK